MYSIIAIRLSHSTVETNSHGDAMSGDRPYWSFQKLFLVFPVTLAMSFRRENEL
jgi:hypothetical protein